MWILMNDSMLSIVRHNTLAEAMLVRGRLADDIERVFPAAQVVEGGGNDYRFRAILPEAEVAEAIHARLLGIDYGNFKASVRDPKRHHASLDVWDVMSQMQEQARSRERGGR
jgi:hypothetical protein